MKRLDLGLALGLWGAALAIRLPYLTLIPFYTDEGVDTLWGLEIALGRHLPLTSVDAYNGPVVAYLMAALFHLFGPSILLPRLVMAIGGALLVVMVYWLARRWGGRQAGLLAASLTLLHPVLVTFTSHVAFSSSLTPLLTLMTIAAMWEGVQRRHIVWFGATGLLAALTLQTHPTSAAGLLGVALCILAQPSLRRPRHVPALMASAGLFLVGYTPVLVANLQPSSPMFQAAQERNYAFGLVSSVADYLTRLVALGRYMIYAIGGIVAPGGSWMQLMAGLVAGLLLASLVYAVWRGQNLIPTIFFSTIVILPLAVHGLSSRYLGGLLPLAHIALGLLGAYVFQTRRRWVFRVGVIGLWAGLLTLSMLAIVTHYQYMDARALTNQGYVQLETTLREQGACGRLYLAAPDMPDEEPYPPDTAVILRTIHYILTLQNCPHIMASQQTRSSLAGVQEQVWIVQPTTSHIAMPNSQPLLTVQLPTLASGFVSITLHTVRPISLP